jgi:2-methylcitrate dehydratase PrpD
VQPYVDCALRLRVRGLEPADIAEIVCEVGEGTVHRLWEPLSDKQRPPNGYAGKFATPYCIATALVRGSLGLDAFTDEAVADPAVRALAVNIRYEVDPANPYPRAFTGHIRATLRDGRSLEERQPHMRGGAHAPLTRAEIEAKLAGNARSGGWTQAQIDAAHTLAKSIWHAAHIDLADLRG